MKKPKFQVGERVYTVHHGYVDSFIIKGVITRNEEYLYTPWEFYHRTENGVEHYYTFDDNLFPEYNLFKSKKDLIKEIEKYEEDED